MSFAVCCDGSGSSSDSSSSAKVGEAGQDTTTEQGTAAEQDSATEEAEVKTEYHVGDILKDGDVQIVYAASGEYQEENEYIKVSF